MSRHNRWWGIVLFVLVLDVSCALGGDPPPEGGPTLDHATLPATGRQEAILTVPSFGRYAVTVSSRQGTALQLIDRMAGPGTVQGTTGEHDGRVDAFLDRGQYKIVTYAHEKGTGKAELKAHPFKEKNAPQPPMLVELKPVNGALDDFEQISYWVEVKERRTVAIEAAGRNLADLRFWTNGNWLVDATPETEIVTPVDGRPLKICRLTVDLNPGLYLLSAYGGASQPWAEDNGEHPFYLRYGIPRLASVIRRRFTVSPFGIDRWRVPGATNFFRIELPEARPASLSVGGFSMSSPFKNSADAVSISKNSLVPAAQTETSKLNDDHTVIVTGAAGQPYILQHFDIGERFWCGGRFWKLNNDGKHWVSTVHSGDPTDSVDATAIVTRWKWWTHEDRHTEPYLDQVVDIGSSISWARHFNLLDTATVFLRVHDTGRYEILSRGSAAKFRIEPFMTYPPPHYETPPFKESGSVWDLDAGYYVLKAEPVKMGIIDLGVQPAGKSAPADLFKQLLGKDRGEELKAMRAGAQWIDADLSGGYSFDLFLNDQPDVQAGLILRKLPVDLTDPLPVRQSPGATLDVPVHVPEKGRLSAVADDDHVIELSVDGGAWTRLTPINAGDHKLTLRHNSDRPVSYALTLEPDRLLASTPLPPLPDPSLVAPPSFPVLAADRRRFLDLDRGQDATFYVRADKPALYRLESTGLLATSGNIRTRTVTSLDRQSENGVGRNFLIEQYLREGDYQLSVNALGQTKGHLGMTLEQAEFIDGGMLSDGFPARAALRAGEGIVYTFTIAKTGTYRVRAMGAGKTFRCRLEDADGWPIEAPNIPADVTRRFAPGTYRLVLVPESVESRRVTLLESIADPIEYKGHGPHILPLAQRAANIWMEPQDSGQRLPDRWEFSVPADIDAKIELTGEMQGEVKRLNDDGTTGPSLTVPASRGWKGRLAAGHYRLETVYVRTNNKQPYEVEVRPEQLVAGLARDITAPATVPLSVGRDGLVEINSFGTADVRARLYDTSGQLVASADDAPGDWNFHITQPLRTGLYQLQVDPVGAPATTQIAHTNTAPEPTPQPTTDSSDDNAENSENTDNTETAANTDPQRTASSATKVVTTISMLVPDEVTEARLSVPAKATVQLSKTVRLYPLQVAPDEEMLFVSAKAAESVGCAIEVSQDGEWRTLGSASGQSARLEIPLPTTDNGHAPAQYRLRLWSSDGRPTSVKLDAVTMNPPHVTEAQLAQGVPLTVVPGVTPHVAALTVKLDRPGIMRIHGGSNIRWSSAPGVPSHEAANNLATAGGALLWLVRDLSADQPAGRLRAMRVFLAPAAANGLQLELEPGAPVVCDLKRPVPGPVLAVATAMVGQPGIRLTTGRDVNPAGNTMAVGTHTAVSVSLTAQPPAAVLWPATPAGDPMDVRLHQLTFPAPAEEHINWGITDDAVDDVVARAFVLPMGAKRLRLTLGESVIAVLSDGEKIGSVHWLGGTPFDESVETTSERLTFLHTRAATDRFHVELLPADGSVNTLVRAGTPFERRQLDAGLLRLAVAAPENATQQWTLHTRGGLGDAILIRSDGSVARGNDVAVGAGGTLLVPHNPGLVLSWLDHPGEEARDLWGATALPKQEPVNLPSSIALAGTVKSLLLSPDTPMMLHLRSATPMISMLQRGTGEPEVGVHANGAVVDAYLPSGPTQLGLRAIGGGALWGTAELTTTPITPIREGLGPEILMPAGATRIFSFAVPRKGGIGVGVRAVPDVVQSTLLDLHGKTLGTGIVQMPKLDPGTYLLQIHVPEGAEPVRVRPALAGVEPPSTGPPADVVRGYLEAAGAVPK